MMPDLSWVDECELSDADGADWRCSESEKIPGRRGMQCELQTHNVAELLDLLKRKTEWVVALSSLPVLKTIASELFLGDIDVEFEFDPEIEDCHYVIFNVTVSEASSDPASLREEWYRRTDKILRENCDKVRLVISIGP